MEAKTIILCTLSILSALVSGCGKQQFQATSSLETALAPGNFSVPPKVDILLAEDDTGSTFEIYPTLAQQMPGFLVQLENRGWDYHFATTPLTTDRLMDQVVASHYDSNWGSAWTPPYPGARRSAAGSVVPGVFKTLFDYTGFLTFNDVNSHLNGLEPGFENLRSALYQRARNTGFLRADALLVIIVAGIGNDTSGVTYCNRPDGYRVPCEQVTPQYGTQDSSFQYYKGLFSALKSSPNLIQFHASVANIASSNCMGGFSQIGTRYQQMANLLNGESFDICTQPVKSILDSLSQRLHATKLALRSHYLFIENEPRVDSVVVTRYPADGGAPVVIPQDPANGWTYAGYLTDVYAVDSPVPMNLASGYAIELHGSAKLLGDDRATVSYMPAGIQSTN